ncbi:class I SAM-dependent methyltransferase [Pseudomonas sp. BN417]|uniref:class I SAM-dependent methyltransferase n=1 Tax=Pseudomonas sp. BN417 TaxID=2567890 RepID=UPI002458D420|nr:class I SAM-dependent methyltransferase [Pseudomonas sp. BN417]MDH4557685.1 class I SAM-dependent methyltransferase [Pseudomonas sp. BN417]
MASATFKDHFSSGSANYAAHRPTYPIALVDELAAVSPGHGLALDCGCGTGQLSVLLAERFDRVVATDASAAQVESAQPHDGVTYRAALAEDSGLPDASVDLITVAQAAHWLDLDKFYDEVRRIARPNAVVALITYGVLHVEGPVDPLVQRFYCETIGPYWPAERRHVEEGYRSLPFPFQERQLPRLAIEVWWTLEDLLGYVNTWSAVKAAEKALGANPAVSLAAEIREVWGDPQVRRRVTWPLSLRVGNVQSTRSSEE